MFEKIVTASKAWSEDEVAMQEIWSAIKGPMVCYLKINQLYIYGYEAPSISAKY
mgnify:CR=1 FL=1